MISFRLSWKKCLDKQTKRTDIIRKQVDVIQKRMIKKRVYNLTTKPFFEQGTDEWLEERKTLISASDCGAAMGEDSYTTPLELLRKKCGLGKPFNGNIFTEHGHKYEDIAAQLYQTKHMQHLHFFGLIKHTHPNIPIGASPDGIREDGVMLEIKVPYSRIPDGTVPPHYEIQTQVQMEVCNLNENDFYECKIAEYDSEMEYRVDGSDRHASNGSIKGIIGEWFHVSSGKTVHRYPPMWCTTSESKQWIEIKRKEMSATHPLFRFGTMIYWKLEMESTVRVERDHARMHHDMVPVFQKTWNDILYHRSNGGRELTFNKPKCDRNTRYDGPIPNNRISGSVFLDDSDSD
jgi:putative phage-type endonuclease